MPVDPTPGQRWRRFGIVAALASGLLVVGLLALASLRGGASEPPDAAPAQSSQASSQPPSRQSSQRTAQVSPGEAAVAAAMACDAAVPTGVAPSGTGAVADAAAELLRNPNVTVCPGAAGTLAAGGVDGRLLTVLALVADRWEYVLALAVDPQAGGAPAAVLMNLTETTSGGGSGPEAVADAVAWLQSQQAPYAPSTLAPLGGGGLLIGFDGAFEGVLDEVSSS